MLWMFFLKLIHLHVPFLVNSIVPSLKVAFITSNWTAPLFKASECKPGHTSSLSKASGEIAGHAPSWIMVAENI